jgi:Lanthionine synthetase C-like protein
VSLSSLYFGLAGLAFALREAGDILGAGLAARAAVSALDLVRSRFDGQRWADQFELLGGNAGIALGALRAGDLDLAVLAVTPYLAAAEPTADGVRWEVRAGVPARFHHLSHGTLGIVYALAATGHAAGRADLIGLAMAGAADVVSRNEAGPDGFLVPHSDPQHKPERIERYSYGWCHGPAGDAQVFRLLGPGHRRPGLDRAGRPMLAHRHRLRPAAAAAARVLGQQRPLLRHSRGPGPGLRPAHRARGRADVRERPGWRPQQPGYRRRRRRALEQLRAPGQPGHAGPAHRMGDGQRRHYPGTAALRPHPGRPGPRLRRRLARPSARHRAVICHG